MKKFTILIILIAFFTGSLFSQAYIQVGSGTVSNNQPFYGSWKNTWSRTIYLQTELGGAKTITQISYDMLENLDITMTSQKIYMKHTSASSVTVGYEEPIANGYTLVYDGSISLVTGWNIIDIIDFNYNGTDNLLILVEDRDNAAHYKNFNCTDYSGVRVATAGCDENGCFATSAGWEPYPKAMPNTRFYYPTSVNPATLPIPNENSYRIDVETDLEFTLDATVLTYDVYFGTSEIPTTKIVSDAAAVNGVNTVDFSLLNNTNLLDSKTDYYWKVVSKNGANTTESGVYKFTTQKMFTTLPYSQDFTQNNNDPNQVFYDGWYGDLTKTDWEYQSSPSNWACWQYTVGDPPVITDYYAYISPFSLTQGESYSLITPRFNLGTGSYDISFYWMNGDATPIPLNKIVGYDKTYFEISTDNGQNWEVLKTLEPSELQTEYQYVSLNISNKGDAVKFRWRYELTGSPTSAKKVFIDNFKVNEASNNPIIQFGVPEFTFEELCIGGNLTYELNITNLSNSNPLIISGATPSVGSPFTCNITSDITINPTETKSVIIDYIPTSAGYQNGTLTFITNSADGENIFSLHGQSLAPVETFFENFDGLTGNPLPLPEHWNSINSLTDNYSAVSIVASSFDSYSQPNVAKILSLNDHVSPIMLITQGTTNFNQNKLSFYAKKGDMNYNMSVIVGVMSNPYDASTFEAVKTFVLTQDFVQYTILANEFPTNNTKPYIAFKHGLDEATMTTSLRIDDIEWQADVPVAPNEATLVFPQDGSNNYDIFATPLLKWGSGGGSPTKYKLYFGTNNPPSNFENGTDMNMLTTYEIIDELEYSTTYYWQIVPENEFGIATNCPIWSFTTMADPTISTYPYLQDFNNVTAGAGFNYPIGWSVENTNGDSFTWDILTNIATPDVVHSAPNAMHMLFSFYDMNDWLFTPPCVLESSKTYTVSFWYKTMGDAIVPNPIEKLSVFLGNDNISTSMEVTSLYENLNLDNLDWQQASFNLKPTSKGTYFLGFQGHSDAFMGLLIIDDIEIDVLTNISDEVTDYKIYPNPTNNNLTLQLNNVENNCNIIISDVVGKIVSKQDINSNTTTLDVQNYKSGIYFITIQNGNNISTEKFIKN